MNPLASFIDKFQTGPIKQRRRHRTLSATALAIAANAGIGIVATDPNSTWYRNLKKPAIQPPNWVFPLVWNPIFLATGHVVGHSLADLEEREGKAQHFTELKESFGANIALNAGWSLLFFRGHAPFLSTIESALLFGSTVDLMQRSRQVEPTRALALAPYVAWTGFATVLTGSIWWLNRPEFLRRAAS